MIVEGAAEVPSVGHTLNVVVTVLDHLIKGVDDRGLEQLDDPALIEFMQSFERLRNRLSVVDHQIIADGQRRDLPTALCQGTMRRVLTSTLSLSKAEAARRVRAAEAVGPRTSMLGETLAPIRPRLAAAQRDGQISAEKVAIIARALGQVDRRGFDPADLDTGEQLLVDQAPLLPPEDLRLLADRVVDAINPDGTLPNDQLNQDRRHVEFHQRSDGSWAGTLRLTGPLGSKLQAVLGPLAKPRTTMVTGPDGRLIEEPDPRHHGQRMHDALEDVCDRLLRSDTIPDAGGTPATVIITIDVEDLLTGTGYGITSDGTLIHTNHVRTMVDQADAYYAFLDRNGVVLNLGRTRRIATRGQSAALYARDTGCSFPGCARAPEYCERHHIIPWIDGGETNLDNLTLVCAYHHHNFLARGWTCRINPDRLPEWTPPRWVDRDQKPLINTRIQATLTARQQARRGQRIKC